VGARSTLGWWWDQLHSDLELVVGRDKDSGTVFHVHNCVLAAASTSLSDFLCQTSGNVSMQGRGQNGGGHGKVSRLRSQGRQIEILNDGELEVEIVAWKNQHELLPDPNIGMAGTRIKTSGNSNGSRQISGYDVKRECGGGILTAFVGPPIVKNPMYELRRCL